MGTGARAGRPVTPAVLIVIPFARRITLGTAGGAWGAGGGTGRDESFGMPSVLLLVVEDSRERVSPVLTFLIFLAFGSPAGPDLSLLRASAERFTEDVDGTASTERFAGAVGGPASDGRFLGAVGGPRPAASLAGATGGPEAFFDSNIGSGIGARGAAMLGGFDLGRGATTVFCGSPTASASMNIAW